MKSNALTFIFGCLGVFVGFFVCLMWFSPAKPESATPITPERLSMTEAPGALSRVSMTNINPTIYPSLNTNQTGSGNIVSPTYPPQVIGTWDPLKMAAEDFARTNN